MTAPTDSVGDPLAGIAGVSPQARITALERENIYLLQRNAQLQADAVALNAELDRTRQMLERLHGRRAAGSPNPLSGGNSPA